MRLLGFILWILLAIFAAGEFSVWQRVCHDADYSTCVARMSGQPRAG